MRRAVTSTSCCDCAVCLPCLRAAGSPGAVILASCGGPSTAAAAPQPTVPAPVGACAQDAPVAGFGAAVVLTVTGGEVTGHIGAPPRLELLSRKTRTRLAWSTCRSGAGPHAAMSPVRPLPARLGPAACLAARRRDRRDPDHATICSPPPLCPACWCCPSQNCPYGVAA